MCWNWHDRRYPFLLQRFLLRLRTVRAVVPAQLHLDHGSAHPGLAWLACRYFPETLYPMGLAAPIGSLISVAICLIALRWIRRHPEKLVMNLHPVETE